MKTPKTLNRLVICIRLLMMGIVAIVGTSVSRAGIVGSYPVDGSTLHLWHFDETNGTMAYDALSNQDSSIAGWVGSFTMTNLPGNPAFPTVANGGELPTEFALNDQPSYAAYTNGVPYISYNYCILTTNESAYYQVGLNYGTPPGSADPVPGPNTTGYENLANYWNTTSGAFTMEALIRFDENLQNIPNGGQQILCGDSATGNRGFWFAIEPVGSGGSQLWFYSVGSTTTGQIPYGNILASLPTNGPDAAIQGQWYHVAVTYTGNDPTNGDTPNILTTYWTLVDPARTNCDVLWTTNVSLNNPNFSPSVGLLTAETPVLTIGASARVNVSIPNSSWAGFDGNIDEVRLSDVCRHPDQMVFNYTNIPEAPTVAGLPASETLANNVNLQLMPVVFGSLPFTAYQWYVIVNGVTNLLVGQTSSTLTIPGVTAANNGGYFLAVTNAYGGTNSVVVQVTVGLQGFDGLYNTGVNNDGTLAAGGTYDQHWFLPVDPDANGVIPYAVVWNFTPSGGGYNPGQWIGPDDGGSGSTTPGTYVYTTSFIIDQGVTNATLSGTLETGGTTLGTPIPVIINNVTNTMVNGVYQGGVQTDPFSFTGTNCGFQMGSNTITFVLTNDDAGSLPYDGIWVYGLTGTSTALTNAPYIYNQPSSVTANFGQTVYFSLVANGAPFLTYEWKTNGAPNTTGGAAVTSFATTNRTLTFVATNVVPSAVYNGVYTNNYYVIVTNSQGSVTSALVELTINIQPTIVSLPATYTNLFTLYAGANPMFSVQAGGVPPPYTYTWFTNGVWDKADTGINLLMTNVQVGFFTNYCVVSNVYAGPVTSAVWTAQVIYDPSNSVSLSPYPASVMALNPIGYWRLNDTNLDGPDNGAGNNGYICDDYAGGNNGVYTNVSLGNQGYNPTSDPSDTSAYFGADPDGGSDFGDQDANSIAGINFGSAYGTSKAFTVEAWVNGYIQTADAGIVTLGYGGEEQFDLDCGSDGAPTSHGFRFLIRDATGTAHAVNSTIMPSSGVWYHLVGVVDEINSQDMAFYINGQLVGTSPLPAGNGILPSTGLMSIGSRSSSEGENLNYQFSGFINDVSVFNYALTASQIQNEYFGSGSIAPVVLQQVTSTNVNLDASVTVPVTVDGSQPISYQWYETNLTAQTGFPLAGETTSNLVLNDIQTNDNYFLAAANSYGETNSNPILVNILGLSVAPGPSSVSLYPGGSYTFTVTNLNSSTPLYYQWYQGASLILNATNASYTAVASLGSVNYYCTVSNAYQGLSVTNAGPVTLIGVAAPTNLYQATVLAGNPIALWRLSEGPDNGSGNNGTIAYDYVGGNNGFYTNTDLGYPGFSSLSSTDTAAYFGKYASTYSFVQMFNTNIDFSTGSNAQFTVTLWANGSNAVSQIGSAGLVSKGYSANEEYFLDEGGTSSALRWGVRTQPSGGVVSFNSSVILINDPHWHFLVGVCDEVHTNLAFYIDGKLVGQAVNASLTNGLYKPGAINPVEIGARGTAALPGEWQFNGLLDDVAIYNYAFTPEQVTAAYDAGAENVVFSTSPTNIVLTSANNQTTLSWPLNHFGWQLQAQTNKVSVGISTNWVNVSGTTATNQVIIPINLTNGSVFYRLIYP
jgi:hypothetical protein